MLVHTVVFWLKKELSQTQRDAFRDGLELLKQIDSAEHVSVGSPAATASRPVIDETYDFMLTTIFTDIAAHDQYQQHELHLAFVADHKDKWERLTIYDAA